MITDLAGDTASWEEILTHSRHLVAPDQLIIADKGFAGGQFEAMITDRFGADLIGPDRGGEPARFGSLGKIRQ